MRRSTAEKTLAILLTALWAATLIPLFDFAVADSGKGIDAAVMPTLFDPVRRSRLSDDRDEHVARLFSQTGLGLSICRKLVATMGSELQVESRVGWGTRFHFTLDLPPCPSRRPASRISGPGRRTAERRRVTPDPRVD